MLASAIDVSAYAAAMLFGVISSRHCFIFSARATASSRRAHIMYADLYRRFFDAPRDALFSMPFDILASAPPGVAARFSHDYRRRRCFLRRSSLAALKAWLYRRGKRRFDVDLIGRALAQPAARKIMRDGRVADERRAIMASGRRRIHRPRQAGVSLLPVGCRD